MKTDQGLECWGVCIVATLIQALSIGLENSYGAVQTVRNSFYLGQAFFGQLSASLTQLELPVFEVFLEFWLEFF